MYPNLSTKPTTSGDVLTQAPHHAPDEPKAQALALRAEGYSVPRIAGLVSHSQRTVNRWLARGREVSRNQETPEMMDDWVRIVRRSQGMQHTVLDILEEWSEIAQSDNRHPLAVISRSVAQKELLKHDLTPNIYAGTGTDKLQKESQPVPIQAQNVIYVFNAAQPEAPGDTIEGAVVDVGENDEA